MDNISREQSGVAIALTLGLTAGGLLGKILVNSVIKVQKATNLTVLQSEDTLTKVLAFTSTLMLGMLLNSSNPYELSCSFFSMGFISVTAVTSYNKGVTHNAAIKRVERDLNEYNFFIDGVYFSYSSNSLQQRSYDQYCK